MLNTYKDTNDNNNNNNNNNHVVPPARISLTLSHHSSLSFITSGRSPGLHPVSSHSRCMYVRAGRSAFARPYVGVHRSTSLMSSSLLLQQCPACLAEVGGRIVGALWGVASRTCSILLAAFLCKTTVIMIQIQAVPTSLFLSTFVIF